ncbi:MAG: hypothetical protein GXO55_11425 [Chloroflexi bacterium]|nr:hypothetical protein [Chloroflexota bacterium]
MHTLVSSGITQTEVGRLNFRDRIEIWGRSLYIIQDFAVTGIGLGSFRYVVPLLYPLFRIPEAVHAHNIFLQAGVDFGVPGLIAYLALVALMFLGALKGLRISATTRWISLGLIGGWTGLHVYGLTDALAFGSKPAILFWLSLGLVAGIISLGDGTHRESNAPK